METVIVIPARYDSERLPGKPLLAQTGKPLIQHVYENAQRSELADQVVVATDDEKIASVVRGFEGNVVMTSASHQSGSERVAEASGNMSAEIIVNVQGDEPELDPAHIDLLIKTQARCGAFASTLACPFPDVEASGPGSADDPACVKVVLTKPQTDGLRSALYFSRSRVPHRRDPTSPTEACYMHVGIYAYSKRSLKAFVGIPPGTLESSERLEQLRILEQGERIAVAIVKDAATGIDTMSDYQAFAARQRHKSRLD